MNRSNPLRRLYSTSLSMAVAAAISIYLFLSHHRLYDIETAANSEFPDCYSIRALTMTAKHSRVDITVSVGRFVEFPRESAIRLLRLVVRNLAAEIEYHFTDFLNVTTDGSNISFFSHDHIGGPTMATLYCRDRLLAAISHVPEIGSEVSEGCSLAIPSSFTIVGLADFCLSNSALHFFGRGSARLSPLHLSTNFSIPIVVSSPGPRKMPNGPEFAIFVSATPIQLWRQLTDVLFPVWAAANKVAVPPTVILLRRDEQRHLETELSRFFTVIDLTEGGRCFAGGAFPRAPDCMPIDRSAPTSLADHLLWMALHRDLLRGFCQALTSERPVLNRVVIDRRGSFLAPRIKRIFPDADVGLLPEDDLAKTADAVSQAHVFIVCHVSAVVLSMFARAAIVEVQPLGLGCTAFGNLWAPIGNAVYMPLAREGACDCVFSNFSCYLEAEPVWGKIDDKELQRTIEVAFERSKDKVRLTEFK